MFILVRKKAVYLNSISITCGHKKEHGRRRLPREEAMAVLRWGVAELPRVVQLRPRGAERAAGEDERVAARHVTRPTRVSHSMWLSWYEKQRPVSTR